jgi:hypothetical protein
MYSLVLPRPTRLNGTQCVPEGALVCTSTHLVDGKDLGLDEKALARAGSRATFAS